MLKELFKERKTIVINTDIDGILSGLLLVKYLGCKIVGFTNSKDKVWLGDGYDDLYGHVFVDMFVTDDKAICIDQHIVAVNDDHQERIRAAGTKFSPQIDGECVFLSDKENNKNNNRYSIKYPFGTTQYLIAQLESEGISVSLPPLSNKIPKSREIKIGDLIHRADDAMYSTLYAYEENAASWWEWLLARSNNSKVITDLMEYLDSVKTDVKNAIDSKKKNPKEEDYAKGRKVAVTRIKDKIRKYFRKNFKCRTSDGGYKNIVDKKGNIKDYYANYVQTIGSMMGVKPLSIPSHYLVHSGEYFRTRWLPMFYNDFIKDYSICGHKVFSYAFIYGPEGNDSNTNFSFTINMK